MAAKSKIISGKDIDDIIENVEKLEAFAGKMVHMDVTLDPDWIVGSDLELLDYSVPALLVKKQGPWGAVRVNSTPEVLNVTTGPDELKRTIMVVIKIGETCRLYQTPLIRCFRRRIS